LKDIVNKTNDYDSDGILEAVTSLKKRLTNTARHE
jgi:hypothetical protein